ncbi:MAG: hypothetical protein OXG44_22120 [Gammaproteobacteria bacterium]|nr:hypothetical protein [Gammaproteobacteria bacterium]
MVLTWPRRAVRAKLVMSWANPRAPPLLERIPASPPNIMLKTMMWARSLSVTAPMT